MPSETSVSGVGRFDIFLTARYLGDEGKSGNINVICELKIDSKPNHKQSVKYADWLFTHHPEDVNLLIYVTPLSDVQVKILSLLDFSGDIYTQLISGFPKPAGKMTEP